MKTKERIILATLDLAAEHGLKSLSMSQIAEAVGIKKPSLYNHFDSKETLIREMYEYVREQSKADIPASLPEFDDKTAYEILSAYVGNYGQVVSSGALLNFYKVIYSERTTNPDAAQILIEETNKMVAATRALFLVLVEQGKLKIDDIDNAALSFAMTIHSLIDYELDCIQAGEQYDESQIQSYIKWFCNQN
jgi:AcrR family transcriptional regulator